MSLINISIGNEDVFINGNDYDPGSVLNIELIGAGRIIVTGGSVEIGNIVGVNALSSRTIEARGDADVTINGGLLGVNAASSFTFELKGTSSITYNASAISVGLVESLLNNFNVKYVGDSTASHFTYVPPAISVLGGLIPATFHVDGMQDLDRFTVDGERLSATQSSATNEIWISNYIPGLLTPILSGLVRQTVNVRIDMNAQEWSDYNLAPGYWLQGDTFTFPTDGFANGVVTGTDNLIGGDKMDHTFVDRDNSNPKDSIDGADGDDDKIDAKGGDDTVWAGAGNDIVWAGDGDDLIYGGTGNDYIFGGNGNDVLHGELGDDTIFGGSGYDKLYGAEGADYLQSSSSGSLYNRGSLLDGGIGNDTLIAGTGYDSLYGGEGDDFLIGGKFSRELMGGEGNDHIVAGGKGFSAVDRFKLDGGEGFDIVDYSLSAGAVKILLNDGVTIIDEGQPSGSSASYTTLTSFEGLVGSQFNDTLGGNSADNLLIGGAGSDTIFGGAGNDSVYGGADDDLIYGDGGDDLLFSGTGNDTIYGGGGRDSIYAQEGDTTIYGGPGADYIQIATNAGRIVIEDFEAANLGDNDTTNNDVVDLSGFYTQAALDSWNAVAANPKYANPLAWMRADAADGILDHVGGGLIIKGPNGALYDPNKLSYENTFVPCFACGTLIDTPQGSRRVEDLMAGDLVTTLDHGAQRLRWIGSRKLGAAELAKNPKLRPIRIAAGALGEGLPKRDLLVSPQHRMLLRSRVVENILGLPEALLAAKHMTVLPGIEVQETGQEVEYFHLLCDAHHILFAEGAPCESLLIGPESFNALGAESYMALLKAAPDLLLEPAPPARTLLRGRSGRKITARLAKNGKSAYRADLCTSREAGVA